MDLAAETDRLLDFAQGSRHPDGGFAWLNDDGTPDLDAPARAVDHDADDARASPSGSCSAARARRSSSATGWTRCATTSTTPSTAAGSPRSAARRTSAPTSTSSSCSPPPALAGRPADELLGEALDVLDAHFWDEDAGALRGRVEPRLERARALPRRQREHARRRGDARRRRPLWRERALRVDAAAGARQPPAPQRALRRRLAAAAGLQPRRSGAPVPALRRHDRALVRVGAAGLHLRRARRLRGRTRGGLFAHGVREGWDGCGFVYTVDWDGTPVVRDHLHWVLCEAIGAAAVLGEEDLQREWWDVAERFFIDREHGSWRRSWTRTTGRPAMSGRASRTSTTPCRRR